MIELKKQSAAPVPVDTGDLKNINLNKQVLRGEDGGYYIPFVNNYGDLNWTASKAGMPRIDTKNIVGPKGAKGEDGKDGKDGYSPSISIGAIDNGHRVYMTDAKGTKQFDVLDGKDGKATVEVKSKYYANDWVEGVIATDCSGYYTDISYYIDAAPADNIIVVDLVTHYGEERIGFTELIAKGWVGNSAIPWLLTKPAIDIGAYMGDYPLAARIVGDSGNLYQKVLASDENLTGFTLYYVEVVKNEND